MGKNKTARDGIEVMRAIYYGDNRMLENALENNINIDATNEFGETALMYACNSGSEEIVKKIVDCGADVNLQNKMGNTPVIYACDNGNKDIVEFLVERGADINHRSYDGKTALLCACSRCKISLIRYLVEKGADVNCETRDGDTPLIRACEMYNFEVVKYLVENGADINARNIVFETALMRTFQRDITDENVKIVTYLVDHGADLDVMNTSVELRDFMKRVIAKEPKIGTIIAMRRGGLDGALGFLKKFNEPTRSDCVMFLARSNTVRKSREDNAVLEKQLNQKKDVSNGSDSNISSGSGACNKEDCVGVDSEQNSIAGKSNEDNTVLERQFKKTLLENIKTSSGEEVVKNIIRSYVPDQEKYNSGGADSSVSSSSSVCNKEDCVGADSEQRSTASIVEDIGRSSRRNNGVKNNNNGLTKHNKFQKKQNIRYKNNDKNSDKNKDKDNDKNSDKNNDKNTDKSNDKGKLSLVNVICEKKFGISVPGVSIVSKMQMWERNGRNREGRVK